MSQCIVTGVAGFIGSTLAHRLLEEGCGVVGIDCLTDYYDTALKRENLSRLRTFDRFRFIEQDLTRMDLAASLDSVETVYHLAGQPGVRASWGSEFLCYTKHNIEATQAVLEACKHRPVRVVYASSSSVYGDTDRLPMREEDPVLPVSPYGVTKLAGEHLCRLYWKSFGLETVSLRYFTVYGPRQRPDMGFHKFFRAAQKGDTISVYGDGEQTRDFTFVDDIVRANLLAASKGKPGEVYNIGGGSRVSLKEVLGTLEEIAAIPLRIEHREAALGDVRHTWSDTSKARKDLDFTPTVDLSQGLRAQWEWFLSRGD
jgi:UDP-glucose 4-epimerase